MNGWLITWAYTARVTATNPKAIKNSLRPNVVVDFPGSTIRRRPCCAPRWPEALRYVFLCPARLATRFQQPQRSFAPRDFRRVRAAGVKVLILYKLYEHGT